MLKQLASQLAPRCKHPADTNLQTAALWHDSNACRADHDSRNGGPSPQPTVGLGLQTNLSGNVAIVTGEDPQPAPALLSIGRAQRRFASPCLLTLTGAHVVNQAPPAPLVRLSQSSCCEMDVLCVCAILAARGDNPAHTLLVLGPATPIHPLLLPAVGAARSWAVKSRTARNGCRYLSTLRWLASVGPPSVSAKGLRPPTAWVDSQFER
jgi:hypothetical protein